MQNMYAFSTVLLTIDNPFQPSSFTPSPCTSFNIKYPSCDLIYYPLCVCYLLCLQSTPPFD